MASDLLQLVDDETFSSVVEKGLVLVDFFAEWCGPCHMQTPILEALAKELCDQLKIVKVDIDKAPQVTSMFRITSVPTLVLLRDGKAVQQVVGVRDADALKELIRLA
jgi:thioredoxin 1